MGKEHSKQVAELDFSNKGLKELPAETLTQFHGVRSLSLGFNQLSDVTSLAKIGSSLRQLDLSRNLLTTLSLDDAGLFASLSALESLDLSCNKIVSLPPALPSLQSLTTLNLSNNKMTRVGKEIAALTRLLSLNLAMNQIGALPNDFGKLVHLRSLELNDNELSASALERCGLSNLTSLTLLNLSRNKLGGTVPFNSLCCLTKLYLDFNQIKAIDGAHIEGMTSLKELTLRGNQLRRLPRQFISLTALQLIDLEDNPLEFADYKSENIADLFEFIKAQTEGNLAKWQSMRDLKSPAASTTGSGPTIKFTMQDIMESFGLPAKRKARLASESSPSSVVERKHALYQVKGTKRIIVRRVAVSTDSLNDGDVFILDTGKKIFLWMGRESSDRERTKALHFAQQLSREECGGAPVIVLDHEEELATPTVEFWEPLGGLKPIDSASAGGDDSAAADEFTEAYKLFKFADIDGRLDIEVTIGGEQISKYALSSNFSYVLDCGWGVFLWAGACSTPTEKSWAMLKAEELASQVGRPPHCKIAWVIDGAETLLFREQFADWADNSWEAELAVGKAGKRGSGTIRKKPGKRGSASLVLANALKDDTGRRSTDESRASLREVAEAAERHRRDEEERERELQRLREEEEEERRRREKEEERDREREKAAAEAEAAKRRAEEEALEAARRRAEAEAAEQRRREQEAEEARRRTWEEEKERRRRQREEERIRKEEEWAKREQDAEKQRREREEFERKQREEREKEEQERRAFEERERKAREQRERETRERLEREQRERERALREERERREREERERRKREREEQRLRAEREEQRLRAEREEQQKREQEQREKALQPTVPKPPASVPEVRIEAPKSAPPTSIAAAAAAAARATRPELQISPSEEPEEEPEEDVAPEEPATAKADVATSTDGGRQLLTGPKRVSGPSSRRKATKNPVRELMAKPSEPTVIDKPTPVPKTSSEPSPATTLASTPSTSQPARSIHLGGYGLLYSLGANAELFQQRRKEGAPAAAARSGSRVGPLKRLLQVKGRRRPFVREVELTSKSLNQGDVFLLDVQTKIYQWNGTAANRIEKGIAMDVAKKIKDKDHFGRSTIAVVESGKEPPDFWTALGERGPIANEDAGADDREAELAMAQCTRLFRVKPAAGGDGGDIVLEAIEERPLVKEMLDTAHCYILDCVGEVFPWTGKKAPPALRSAAVKKAEQIAAERPFWVAPVQREIEGGETVLFCEKFSNWGGQLPIAMKQVASGVNVAATRKQEKIDVAKLHAATPPAKVDVMVDDGSGQVQVFRVEGFEKVTVPQSRHGHFYDGDSYIILYHYIWKNKDQYLLYFWQGRNSSINEKGTSALLTIELDNTLEGMTKEVRVVQNKEQKHFMTIFKGKLVVHKGKESANERRDTVMYHIREYGTESFIRAIETRLHASSLNSNNAFAVQTPTTHYAWLGKCSTPAERAFATSAPQLDIGTRKVVTVEEGKEPTDFWAAVGGPAEYPLKLLPRRLRPRLFQCSVATGVFVAEEIYDFCQDDLVSDDVMILDAFDVVYVWIGRQSDEKEKKMGLEVAIEYAKAATDGRPTNTSVYVVYDSAEPLVFITHFHAWDYGRKRDPASVPMGPEGLALATEVFEQYTRKYTYKELLAKQYPKGIDTSRLEDYMDDDEFERVLKMTREQFAALPPWKRTNLKKELNLF